MGAFAKGQVVLTPFPFSDLSDSKLRPALVVANLIGPDVILCMITSQPHTDGYSIPLTSNNFTSGSLQRDSYIRPNRLFTADSELIERSVGTISATKLNEVIRKIIQIIR